MKTMHAPNKEAIKTAFDLLQAMSLDTFPYDPLLVKEIIALAKGKAYPIKLDVSHNLKR
tara:strand:- start:1411 stop:1587 length:177 start_codon:yes stop_codon:yes gene_type:complete